MGWIEVHYQQPTSMEHRYLWQSIINWNKNQFLQNKYLFSFSNVYILHYLHNNLFFIQYALWQYMVSYVFTKPINTYSKYNRISNLSLNFISAAAWSVIIYWNTLKYYKFKFVRSRLKYFKMNILDSVENTLKVYYN